MKAILVVPLLSKWLCTLYIWGLLPPPLSDVFIWIEGAGWGGWGWRADRMKRWVDMNPDTYIHLLTGCRAFPCLDIPQGCSLLQRDFSKFRVLFSFLELLDYNFTKMYMQKQMCLLCDVTDVVMHQSRLVSIFILEKVKMWTFRSSLTAADWAC